MSVRREVVSLSQLLRRGDNPKARRGTTASRMPPLPLQTSARRTAPPSAAEQKRASAPFIERSSAQKSSRYQPQSLARRPRSESRLENSQPEVQTASHSRKAYMPLSQEVYDGEGEDVSVVTSLSQSSFSQPPSQNLLASSQDDQLYRLQQWQDPQDGLTQCSAPSIYTEMVQQADKHPSQVSSEQVQRQQQEQRDKERQQLHELQARERQLERQVRELQEREKGLQEQQERDRKLQEQRERDQELRQQREKELAQLREQREKELSEMRQQRLQELMTRFASPIKKSVEGMNMSLTSSTNEHKQQMATLAELSEGVNGIAVSVAELRQQNLEMKSIRDDCCKTTIQETSAVKAALEEVQGKIDSIEGSVKECSGLFSCFLEREGKNREALLAAVAASSCKCTQEKAPVEDIRKNDKKRKRYPHHRETPERSPSQYTPARSRFAYHAQLIEPSSPHHYERDGRTYRRRTDGRPGRCGLRQALQRIEALRAKRCCQFTGL